MKPAEPHPRPEAHLRGRHIEDRLLARLKEAQTNGTVYQFLLPDSVVINRDGQLFFVEAKAQSRFEAPPFDGHGLPVAQANRYAFIFAAYKIRTQLIVWDDETCWWQWMDVLEAGRHFETAGTIKTPRRIYPISSFIRADEWREGRTA